MLKFNNIEGVIFTVEDLESQRERIPFEGELWNPSRAEVIELEMRFPATLRTLLGDKYDDYVFYEISTYVRQYVGVTLEDEKCIWLNCFCGFFDQLPNYWEHIQIGANPCFIRLVWHPGTQTFSHFTTYDEY